MRITSNICSANSLVGVIIIAPSPSLLLQRSRYSFSITGITKAKVFPELIVTTTNVNTTLARNGYGAYPVFAAPKISLPANAWGRAAACISVAISSFAADSASNVLLDSGRSLNRISPSLKVTNTTVKIVHISTIKGLSS